MRQVTLNHIHKSGNQTICSIIGPLWSGILWPKYMNLYWNMTLSEYAEEQGMRSSRQVGFRTLHTILHQELL